MPTTKSKPRLTSLAPQFLVDDLARSMNYYRKLGFTFGEPWGGFYAIGQLDGLELHLKEAPRNDDERQHRRANEHLDAAAGVDGIEAFHAQCAANGVTIIRPLTTTPWGTKDFYIEDPDGYVISFGGRILSATADQSRTQPLFPEDHIQATRSPRSSNLTPISWPTAGTVDAHIRTEQVRAIFQHALFAHILSISLAFLVAYVLRDVAESWKLKTWLAVMVVMTAGRAATTIAFRLRNPAPEQMVAWERAFVLTIAASSLAWGVGGVWITPRDSLAHQAFIYFFLSGIAGGALATYAAHPMACLVTISCLLVPPTVWFAFQDVLELRAMALAGTLYVVTGFRALRHFQFFLRRTFLLSWELQEAYGHARELANTDSLTGLNNRRAFSSLGEKALALADRHSRAASLVMFDVDQFKRINDTYGHAAGDRVLEEVAEVIRRVVRSPDIAGRIGGEEFALVLPETTGSQAAVLAERLRQTAQDGAVHFEGKMISFTCSFGVASTGPDVKTLEPLLSKADQALYRAKEKGRNRVSTDQLVMVKEP